MAKKRAKPKPRGNPPARPRAKPKAKADQGPYIGDQILAVYFFFCSCCALGFLSLLAAASFGIAARQDIVSSFQTKNPSPAWKYLSNPEHATVIGIILVALLVLQIYWLVSTWKGRRGALWLHLGINANSAALTLALGDTKLVAIFPLAVSIYCTLRLTNRVGPGKAGRR